MLNKFMDKRANKIKYYLISSLRIKNRMKACLIISKKNLFNLSMKKGN